MGTNCKFITMKIALLFLWYLIEIESKMTVDLTFKPWISTASHTYYHALTGSQELPVTDRDITSFFSKTLLYDAVERRFGRRPTHVYYRPPTPWGDLYSSYGWAPVTKIIKPVSVQVVNVYTDSSVVMTQEMKNPSSIKSKMNANLHQEVRNSVTSSWYEYGSTVETSNFDVELKFLFLKLGGGGAFTSTSGWGRSETRYESVTIASDHGVEVELQPGQSVRAELSVTVKHVEILVMYEVQLRGRLAVHFQPTHRGHYFYGPSVRNTMRSARIDNSKYVTQTMKIAYHIDAKTIVRD